MTTTNGVAIGPGASVSGANSVALGSGSSDLGRSNTVSVGSAGNNRTISNLAPGVLGSDAVNVNQLKSAEHLLKQGIATSMAMSSMITPSAPGKTTIGFNGATYAGYYSAAINFAHRVNTDIPLYVTGAVGAGGAGSVGGRVGMAVEF